MGTIWAVENVAQTFCKNLARLLLGDSFYLLQDSARGVGNRLDSIETAIDNKLNVSLCEASNTLPWKWSVN